ncbi:MAG: tRNA lysidine(34) synthetase TilS [Deltaproteobacteria bacterium]|nr:MAG: tRNA lysidine(34) synthetase TilS [Deltaproteobacteria bacterium]
MVLPAVAQAVEALDLVGQRILVAVSGGLDSTALVHALRALDSRFSLKLLIGHVNHGLRGDASEADEEAVRRLGSRLGIDVRVERVEPHALRSGRSSRERPTLEEAARTLRYAALDRMATAGGAGRIATAHTRNDQAETVLLRLFRGTGPDGLGGIRERSRDGRIVRPLLRLSRAELERFARDRGLEWREDPTNASREFARSRLRRDWLPGLEADFNPQLLRAVADLAEAQRRDSDWIEALVDREAERWIAVEEGPGGRSLRLDRTPWDALPEALARRLARWALVEAGIGRDVSRVHLERVLCFLRDARSGGYIELPGDRVLACDADAFRLGPRRLTLRGAC